MTHTLAMLEWFLAQGYCLHGTKKPVPVLEPRLATCTTGNVSGCQLAVYAEKDDLRIPCLMAMFCAIDPKLPTNARYSGSWPEGTLVVTGTNTTFQPGYVHVLCRRTFEEFGDNYISRVPVTPVDTVLVTPDILRNFKKIDIRIPVPTIW